MISSEKRVVIIDDDVSSLELLDYNFLKAGYATECFSDSMLALNYLKTNPVDCVITDWMMPSCDGLELVTSLRDSVNSSAVKIMVSCKEEESKVIEALNSGLDDYMMKPLRVKELVARTTLCLGRKNKGSIKDELLTFNGLVMDITRFEVRLNGLQVKFSKSEFGVLELMLRNRNRLLSRDYLLEKIHGEEVVSTPRSIDVIVHSLRTKLSKHGFDHIQTVYGMGYKMI